MLFKQVKHVHFSRLTWRETGLGKGNDGLTAFQKINKITILVFFAHRSTMQCRMAKMYWYDCTQRRSRRRWLASITAFQVYSLLFDDFFSSLNKEKRQRDGNRNGMRKKTQFHFHSGFLVPAVELFRAFVLVPVLFMLLFLLPCRSLRFSSTFRLQILATIPECWTI
jgi:hypothetical protein